jgi:hypothetical protein
LNEALKPFVITGAAVSRIWDALKQAENERSRAKGRKPTPGRLDEHPSENAHRISDEGANESSQDCPQEHPNSDGADRRRSKRWDQPVPVLLYGSDSEKQPFHEETETIDINDDGCSFTIATAVAKGKRLFLVNMLNDSERECRVIQATMQTSVQAPVQKSIQASQPARGKALVAVEFSSPAPDFWTARKR